MRDSATAGRRVPAIRARRPRKGSVVAWGSQLALVGVSLPLLSGCVIEPDSEHDVSVEVRNQCAADIAVLVGTRETSFRSEASAAGMYVVTPGEARLTPEIFRRPLGANLYLWVVGPAASLTGEPVALPINSLTAFVDEYGVTTYLIDVEGDLCP